MKPSEAVIWGISAFALVAAVTGGLLIGPASLPPLTVWHALLGLATDAGGDIAASVGHGADSAIVYLRLLRSVGAGLTGACLGLAGLLLQSTTRNPLADPYLLGTSAGATLAIVAATTLAGGLGLAGLLGPLEPLLALIGALAATSLAFRIGAGAGGAPDRIVLAGLVLTAFAGAAASLLLYRADDASLRAATQWLMGGVVVTSPWQLFLPLVLIVVATVWASAHAAGLDALLLGPDAARGVGVDTERLERRGTWLAAGLTAFAVALAGIVGFVGLLVPHGARALVGSDHRRLIPATALGGAAFLLAVDILCRVAMAPAELPIGIPTALGGVPVLVALLGAAHAGVRQQAPALDRRGRQRRHASPTRNSGRDPAPAGDIAAVAGLRVVGLGVHFEGVDLLRDVHLDLACGELTVLVGPTGAGKSTLLRALAGAVWSEGTIDVHGVPRIAGNAAGSDALTWLPQRVELPRGATVAHLVGLPLRLDGGASTDHQPLIDAALHRFGLNDMAHRLLTSLSGGQLQRALLAMALAKPTPLVLLDEPTAALDVVSAHAVLQDLARLAHEQGRIVVVASHDLNAALAIADRIVAIADGRVVGCARTDDGPGREGALVAAFGAPVIKLLRPI